MFKPANVIDVEVSRPVDSIRGLDSGGRLHSLIRWHGLPLGRIIQPSQNDKKAMSDISNGIASQHWRMLLRHQLRLALQEPAPRDGLTLDDLIRTAPTAYGGPFPLVTVAVCTRDRATDLALCLDALMDLDYPALDLLVVDNAPDTEATARLVATYSSRVRYFCEPRPGLDWARNHAAREARGDIVAYTDDDVSVDPGWVKAIADAFEEEPHAMCVTGLVLPDELDTPAQLLFEKYGGFGRGFKRWVYRVDAEAGQSAGKLYGGTGRFGTGANMAFRRRFFETEGFFDPALDVGTPSNGGGDLEMFFRVLKAGAALVYEPAAMVRHRHRRDYASLKKQIANNGIGFYAYLVRTAQAYPEERAALARLGTWWLWWWNVRRLLRALVRPRAFPVDLIVAELKGSFIGLRRYAASRRHAAGVLRQFGAPEPLSGGTR